MFVTEVITDSFCASQHERSIEVKQYGPVPHCVFPLSVLQYIVVLQYVNNKTPFGILVFVVIAKT